ncbi:MAG TPA: hypothetical protein PLF86_02975 [Candidatus Moranbacteria bacterium]|jgi:outer membrane protein assembly factor BamE (lipoprotein component of BamABCDE complex)|nr:hypothetical protein [Candidatus Moranbacteria bacterium]
MKKILLVAITAFLAAAMMTSCAGTCKNCDWDTTHISALKKGDSQQAVLAKIGEPTRKSWQADGSETWEYRKPNASQNAMNKFAAFSSWGIYSGDNSVYLDILWVHFNSRKRVKNFVYKENTMADLDSSPFTSQPPK